MSRNRDTYQKLCGKIQLVLWSDDPIPNSFGPGYEYLQLIAQSNMVAEGEVVDADTTAYNKVKEELKQDENQGKLSSSMEVKESPQTETQTNQESQRVAGTDDGQIR